MIIMAGSVAVGIVLKRQLRVHIWQMSTPQTDTGPGMAFETNKATSIQTIPPTRVQAFKYISPSCPHTITSAILYFVSIVAITGNPKGFIINSRTLLQWYMEERAPYVGEGLRIKEKPGPHREEKQGCSLQEAQHCTATSVF